MRGALLFCLVLHVAHGTCPDGFDLVKDGQCRGQYGTLDSVNWNEGLTTATAKCKELQSTPVIIHTEEEQAYWHARHSHTTVIGIMCDYYQSRKWVWVDGSEVDYRPSAGVIPAIDEDCTKNWQYSWVQESDGKWDMWTYECPLTHDIFCIKQLQQPVIPVDGCFNFASDDDDGVCYSVGGTAENWQDAQMICLEMGANLASIHNLNENNFVRRMAVSIGAVNGIFLGAKLTGNNKDFNWVDGFPMKNTGDCIAMDTWTSSGQWMNIECTAKLPVACIRQKQPAIDIPEPTCDTGPYDAHVVITSPGFPFNASMPCDFFLTADEGTSFELEIILLEANSCCDYVVIHDGFLGGAMLANLTSSITNTTITSPSNFMRVSWQPNGGVNVKGLAMTFRGV